MPTLRIIHDSDRPGSKTQAEALARQAPADFGVSIAPLHRPEEAPATLGEVPTDLVLLLGEANTAALRQTLTQRGWQSKLAVACGSSLPSCVAQFTRRRDAADAWLFADRISWEAVGRLPRTSVIHSDGEPDLPRLFQMLRELLDPDQPAVPRTELAAAVTVFVTTVGAPTFDNCLRHLRDQDCTFQFQIIDRVAPMNLAFQRMLDECRTPYYVQVDEDMLLHPHAVRTLYQAIEAAGPRLAIYVSELYDVHLARCIHGLKIFRHEVVRRYPFGSGVAFELEQVAQLENDGYAVWRSDPGPHPVPDLTLGLHGTQWTLQSIYERYATLERARRSRPLRRQWFAQYSTEFLRRFLDAPTEENFFSLMGVVAGVVASRNGEPNAKDYRTYDALPGFGALRQFLREVASESVHHQRHAISSRRRRPRAHRRNAQR